MGSKPGLAESFLSGWYPLLGSVELVSWDCHPVVSREPERPASNNLVIYSAWCNRPAQELVAQQISVAFGSRPGGPVVSKAGGINKQTNKHGIHSRSGNEICHVRCVCVTPVEA